MSFFDAVKDMAGGLFGGGEKKGGDKKEGGGWFDKVKELGGDAVEGFKEGGFGGAGKNLLKDGKKMLGGDEGGGIMDKVGGFFGGDKKGGGDKHKKGGGGGIGGMLGKAKGFLSDASLKTNIETIESPLEILERL